MIELGEYEEFGKTNKYVSIDLSTPRNENRVLDFLQTRHIITGDFEYIIKAQWTSEKFHPSMKLTEDQLIAFSEKINLLVEEINAKRNK